jgi:hypothetical protein
VVRADEEFRIGLTTFRVEKVPVPAHGHPGSPGVMGSDGELKEQIFKAKVGGGETQIQSRRAIEDELQAVLDFIDYDRLPVDPPTADRSGAVDDESTTAPPTKPKSERDTDSAAGPSENTATPSSLFDRIAAEQEADRAARQRAKHNSINVKSRCFVALWRSCELKSNAKLNLAFKRRPRRTDWPMTREFAWRSGRTLKESRAEAEGMRVELEDLQSRMQREIEEVQRAEAEATRMALKDARESAQREAEEQAQRLLAEKTQELATALERAKEEAERLAADDEERRRAVEQREKSLSQQADIEQASTRKQATERRKAAIHCTQGPDYGGESGFDPYYRWLAIRPDEQPADHYRLLGVVRFEDSWEVIERSVDRQMAYVRMHQLGKHARQCQALLNELAAAKVTLLDPGKKKPHDERLLGELGESDLGLPDEDSADDVPLVPSDGAAFQEYLLLDYFAAGETGQMFYAQHRTLGRRVALNVLSKAAGQDPDTVKRFQRKSQILACWHHPHLVPVYDAGQQDGIYFFVMQFVEGQNLLERLKQTDPMSIGEAVNLTIQAADGLDFLHQNGVIHRNVSPKNLLVGSADTLKIIGLGQSLYTTDCPLGEVNTATDRNGEDAIGSFDYMAPEQARHSAGVDARADIYSLGCTLFTILTKEVVFASDRPTVEAVSRREMPPESLSSLRQDVPCSLDAVFLRMVAPDRDRRYDSMREVIAALRTVIA